MSDDPSKKSFRELQEEARQKRVRRQAAERRDRKSSRQRFFEDLDERRERINRRGRK